MCFGGGGNPSKDAAVAEAARQRTISGNVANINSAYAGRAPQYAQLGEALRARYGTELKRQQDQATRQSKFALARGGLTGGSAAIDQGINLAREASAGTIAAEQKARGGVASLQSQDEAARLNLISLAQSGSDIGNAAQQAASTLRANLETAQNTNTASGLGDVFGNTAATYKAQQDAAARRKGLAAANPYSAAFTRPTG